jgi:chromosome segregation ATPase
LEVDSLRSKNEEMTTKCSKLIVDLDEALFRETQHSKTVESLKQEIAEKEDIIASVENEMFSMRQDMASGANDLAELEELQSQLQQALSDNESLHASVKQLKKELKAAQEKSQELDASLEAFRNEMKETMDVKDKRIAHLDKHKITKEHIEMINKLKEEKKKAQEDNKIMKKQLSDLKAAYESVKDQPGKVSTRSSKSSSSTSEAPSAADMAELRAQLEAAQNVTASLKTKLKECSKQLQVIKMSSLSRAMCRW